MSRNRYFSQSVASEQSLVEDLVVEAISIYAQDTYYLPRSLISRDTILNESIESKFGSAHSIEMYIENVDGFGGDGTLFTKFGLDIREQASFVVSRRRWTSVAGRWPIDSRLVERPNEGDLIYLPLTKSLMEVKWVENKSPFFQLSKVPVWKLSCELFEYGNERIDTGISEIDSFERQLATSYTLSLGSGNSTAFLTGEKVKQVVSLSGPSVEVYATVEAVIDPSTLRLGLLSSNSGRLEMFQAGTGTNPLVGLTSGASRSVTKVWNLTDTPDRVFDTNDRQAQNSSFERTANDALSFDERNPFGEPSDL